MKRPFGFLFASSLVIVPGAVIACGGAQPEPVAPEVPLSAPSPAPPAASAPEPPATGEGTSSAGAVTEPSPASEPAPPALDPDAPTAAASETGGRNIKYIVSPDGIKVKVDGVVFTPTAEPKRMGNAWGVEVRVEARAEDDAPHSLLAPKGGEIALAGQVARAGEAGAESLSDRRTDDRELVVTQKKAVKLRRMWPAKDGPKPLAVGDSARLEVGIWGLGAEATSRKPVKGLCRIEVKFDKDKPRVKVMAPEGVSK